MCVLLSLCSLVWSISAEIGVGLTGFGSLFLVLGILLFFDKAMLALGNVSRGAMRSPAMPTRFTVLSLHVETHAEFARFASACCLHCTAAVSVWYYTSDRHAEDVGLLHAAHEMAGYDVLPWRNCARAHRSVMTTDSGERQANGDSPGTATFWQRALRRLSSGCATRWSCRFTTRHLLTEAISDKPRGRALAGRRISLSSCLLASSAGSSHSLTVTGSEG